MDIFVRIKNSKYYPYLASALSGVLLALAYRFAFLWWICLAALIPLCTVLFTKDLTYKGLIGLFLCFCLFYYCPTLLWLFEIAVVIQSSVGVTASYIIMALAIIAISLIMGVIYSLPMLLFKRLRRNNAWDIPLFAALYASGEMLVGLMGVLSFPWGRIANIAVACLPFAQIASLGGGLLLGFIVTAVNGILARALLLLNKDRLRAVLALATACLILGGNLLFGGISMLIKPSSGNVNVLLVQGNFPNNQKWTASTTTMLNKYLELSRNAITEETDLVFWPETAIPLDVTKYENITHGIRELATEKQVTIAVGYIEETEHGTYNAMRLYYPDGSVSEDFYAKQLLVPMGEFTPFKELFGTVFPSELGDLAARNLTHGDKTVVFPTQYGDLNGMICYESILPRLQLDATRKGSGLICMITNDSWFGTSNALDQHLAQAQLRAIENGRFLARSGNSGITAIITPSGTVTGRIPTYQSGTLDGSVSFICSRTLYTVIGDIPFAAMLATCIILFIMDIIKQKMGKKCKILFTNPAK